MVCRVRRRGDGGGLKIAFLLDDDDFSPIVGFYFETNYIGRKKRSQGPFLRAQS